MNKKWLGLFVIIFSLLLVGCTSETTNKEEVGEENKDNNEGEKEITYASTSEPIGLSPIGTFDTVSGRAIVQIYERLFMFNPETNQIEPHLAKSYERPDETTWIIQLNEGIKFHDGTPFNAEAVKYTFETFINPETASPAAHTLSAIDKIETDGEYTVIIHTKTPTPTFLNTLAAVNSSIVSPTAYQNQDLMQKPVGTGPFKFVNWTKGSDIVLERNEDYWQGVPEIHQLKFLIVPEMSTALSMLQTGDVQLVDGLDAQQLQRAESINSVDVLKEKGTYVYFFSVNHEKAPMNELPFRQALAYALDLESYRNQLGGTGYKSNGMIGPTVAGYDLSIENFGYEYDPEKAKKIIKEHGYDKYELTFLATTHREYMKFTEILQAQLTDIGLNVKIESMDWASYLSVTAEGKFDLYILGTTNASAGIDNLINNLHSKNVGKSNRMRYNDPIFDGFVDQARSEFDDGKRQELFNEAHQRIIENVGVVPLHHAYVIVAHSKNISGIKIYPDGMWSLAKAKIN
ncbi:ABC transporter substrate-binding protein [Bacillus sp. JJ1503]|uniref:ABC transporter substrate-binding protein n=1 Tax=Bacillus sp. JJ1503 TaxID=3122956 RepID=UPI002FFEEACD